MPAFEPHSRVHLPDSGRCESRKMSQLAGGARRSAACAKRSELLADVELDHGPQLPVSHSRL